jgi:sec-independent protein translocase protein TatA
VPEVYTAGLIGGLGLQELLLILAVLLILFGGKKIPELAKGLGEGIRNFKTGLRDEEQKKTPPPQS